MVRAAGVQRVSGFQPGHWARCVAWLAAAAMLGSGCTTVKSKQLPPEALQAQIRNGSAVQAGDEVVIVTKDGNEHTLKVSVVGTAIVLSWGPPLLRHLTTDNGYRLP